MAGSFRCRENPRKSKEMQVQTNITAASGAFLQAVLGKSLLILRSERSLEPFRGEE